MKIPPAIHRKSTLILFGSIAALLAAPSAKATDLYWDTNSTAAGSGLLLTGTWGADQFWTTANDGITGTYQATTAASDNLIITADPVATGTVTAIGTITVSGTQYANGIVIKSGTANLDFRGGTIDLGAGGLTYPQYAYGVAAGTDPKQLNTNAINFYSNLNLSADQTWTSGANTANNPGIQIQGDISGSGNLTLINSNSPNSRLWFRAGSSANWTGSLTMDGGNLAFDSSKLLTTRLNNTTLTLRDTYVSHAILTAIDAGAVTNFTNNIVYENTGGGGFNISLSSASRGGELLLSGVLSGTHDDQMLFMGYSATPDLSGTGQFGRFRISGNNTDWSLTRSSSAVIVRYGYLYLDSNNALGLNNAFSTQIGVFNSTVRSGSGLYAADGITVAGNVTVITKGGATGEAYLGLDGTGSALYTGTITLNNASSTNFVNNLHLRAFEGGTATFTGNIADSGSNAKLVPVIVDGGGTVVLTGTNSSYFGNTIVNAGTLKLDFANSNATANILNAGTTVATNKSALVMGGGTLDLTGKASTVNSQRFNGVTIGVGSSKITLSDAADNALLLNLGAITRNAAGTLDITLPAGTQSDTHGITTSSIDSISNNVLVSAASDGIAYATVGGTDWASLSGSNVIALSSYNVDSFTITDNTDVTSDQAVADVTVNTLRFNDTAARTVTMSGVNTVSTGGILVTGQTAANGAAITGGSLRAGSGKELVVINNGKLSIGSSIVDNSAASSLTISGAGMTTLSGANTYTGATVVNSGTLSVSNLGTNGNLGNGTSAVVLGDGGHKGTLSYTGNDATFTRGFVIGAGGGEIDVTTAGQTLTVTTGSTTYQSSLGTYGDLTLGGDGNIIFNSVLDLGFGGLVKNGAGTVTLNTANTYSGETRINGGTLKLGVATGLSVNSPITINNATLDLGGFISSSITGALTLDGGIITNGTLALGYAPIFVTSGTISAGLNGNGNSIDGSIIKTGPGTLLISGVHNHVGAINILGGTLAIGASNRLRDSSVVNISGATLDVGAYVDTVGGVTMSSGTIAGTGIGQVTTAGGFVFTDSGTVTAKLGGASTLTKSGAGTVTLSGINSYSGATTINGGKLAVNGSISTGAVTVNSGGTLGGSGTVAGAVTVNSGAHFAPGNSISPTFQTGALTLNAGSISDFELGTASASKLLANGSTTNDRTTMTGALTLGGSLNLIDNSNADGLGSAGAGSYLLFSAGSVSGSFSSVNNIGGFHSEVETVGNNVYVDLNHYANQTLAGDALTIDGANFTLNLGTFNVDTGTHSATITLTNTQIDAIYQDLLGGTFDVSGASAFTLEGFDNPVSLGIGGSQTMTVTFDTTGMAQDTYTGHILFNGTSVNGSGAESLTQIDIALEFQAVPEPTTWAMVVGGMGMMAFAQRLRRRMSC